MRVPFRDRTALTNFAAVVTNVPGGRVDAVPSTRLTAHATADANSCTAKSFTVVYGACPRMRGTPVALCPLRRAIVHNA